MPDLEWGLGGGGKNRELDGCVCVCVCVYVDDVVLVRFGRGKNKGFEAVVGEETD